MFGKNKLVGSSNAAGVALTVNSVFKTIQGEGPLSGTPAIFVRLTGCNLRCTFCFSGSTWIQTASGVKVRIKDILKGTMVLSYDNDLSKIVKKKVTNVWTRQVNSILKIHTGSKSLYVTSEHPLYVVGKGWVTAGKLQEGDILFELTQSDRMTIRNPITLSHVHSAMLRRVRSNGARVASSKRMKKTWRTTNIGKIVKRRMKTDNPMRQDSVAIASYKNRKHSISSIEKLVIQAVEEAKLPIKYVGNGKLFVGRYCPDFLVLGTNKTIDVWSGEQTEYLGRDLLWQKKRKAYFSKRGYSLYCLPVQAPKARSLGLPYGSGRVLALRQLISSLSEIVHNGAKVTKIEHITSLSNPKAYARLAGSLTRKIQVYNLEVEDTHTYFANSVLAHNCDTEFETGEPISIQNLVYLVKHKMEGTPVRWVVLTGGEPFLQNFIPFVALLAVNNICTQVETAGTKWVVPEERERVEELLASGALSIVVSPKTPVLNPHVYKRATAFKYIIREGQVSMDDGLPLIGTQWDVPESLKPYTHTEHKLMRPYGGVPVYVQPCDEHDEEKTKRNIQLTKDIALRYGYRISLQLHKLLDLP